VFRYRFVVKTAALTGLCVLGCLTASTLGAENGAWIVRPVATGVSVENVDVMAGPDGEAIVGYAAKVQPGSGGNVVVARLPTNGAAFQLRTEPGGGDIASFAADHFGNVFYSSRDPAGGGIRVGQDFGGFGNLLSSLHPASGIALPMAVPTMGVNPSGMPVLADMDQFGTRFLSTFNAIAAQWQTEAVSGPGLDSSALPAGPNCQSLAFDSAGNAVLAYVQQTGSPVGPLVVARRGTSGWENVATDAAFAMSGASVAAGPDGSVGFVYTDASCRLSFNSYGDALGIRETISDCPGWLTPHSLAFDGEGNPAVVYGWNASTPTPLRMARCNAQGKWTDEVLPVDGPFASLAFDAQGDPLVVACTYDGVVFLTQSVPEPGTLISTAAGVLALMAYALFRRRGRPQRKPLLPKPDSLAQWR
jgi:hypothetical protein